MVDGNTKRSTNGIHSSVAFADGILVLVVAAKIKSEVIHDGFRLFREAPDLVQVTQVTSDLFVIYES